MSINVKKAATEATVTLQKRLGELPYTSMSNSLDVDDCTRVITPKFSKAQHELKGSLAPPVSQVIEENAIEDLVAAIEELHTKKPDKVLVLSDIRVSVETKALHIEFFAHALVKSANNCYEVQELPDTVAVLDNGSEVTPLVTLKEAYGGVAHIIDDDHCHVLVLQKEDGRCVMATHWFPEAAQALALLLATENCEPDRYSPELYWIDDGPADWTAVRIGELFVVNGMPYGHPERDGVVYRKCNHAEGQDSLGNAVAFDPAGQYITLKPKQVGETLGDVPVEKMEKDLLAALDRFPASASSECTAPMTIKAFGNDLDELIIDIKERFCDSGATEGVLGKVTVKANHNRTVDKKYFAQAHFEVPPADSIRNRSYPWTSLLDHRAGAHNFGTINGAIDVLRLDARGPGGACHDYLVLAGIHGHDKHWTDESHDQLRRDIQNRSYPLYENPRVTVYALRYSEEGVTRYAVVGYDKHGEIQTVIKAGFASLIRFQNGPSNEFGVNGVTHEALLTILLDRLRGFQAGPRGCRENALALTKLEEGLQWLQSRGKRSMEVMAQP